MEKVLLEKTYIMVKPDGVQRGIIGEIISRFERKGFQLMAMKMLSPSKEILEEHYGELKTKSFFPKLIQDMQSGPVVGMIWQGKAAVTTCRKMLGTTNPLDSAPGTIRGDFCLETGRNVIHGSDSVKSAEREIGIWFKPEEIQSWSKDTNKWIYELNLKH